MYFKNMKNIKRINSDIMEILMSDYKVEKDAYTGPGEIINSEFLNGLKVPEESIIKTIKILEEKK